MRRGKRLRNCTSSVFREQPEVVCQISSEINQEVFYTHTHKDAFVHCYFLIVFSLTPTWFKEWEYSA